MKINVGIYGLIVIALFQSTILFTQVSRNEIISGELSKETENIIEKHTQFLIQINCSKMHKIHFSGIHFNNIILIECLKEIEDMQSFVPLLKTWKKIKNLPEKNTLLIGQYTLMLLLSYHVSIGCYTQQNRLAWLSLISLYTQLNMIPLNKLFDALDECYTQYQIIIKNLPENTNESWSSWLQEYWWAPTTILIFTFYSFLRWQQKHSTK